MPGRREQTESAPLRQPRSQGCARAPADNNWPGMSPPLPATTPTLTTVDWGLTAYAVACQRQEELVARRNAGETGDTYYRRLLHTAGLELEIEAARLEQGSWRPPGAS